LPFPVPCPIFFGRRSDLTPYHTTDLQPTRPKSVLAHFSRPSMPVRGGRAPIWPFTGKGEVSGIKKSLTSVQCSRARHRCAHTPIAAKCMFVSGHPASWAEARPCEAWVLVYLDNSRIPCDLPCPAASLVRVFHAAAAEIRRRQAIRSDELCLGIPCYGPHPPPQVPPVAEGGRKMAILGGLLDFNVGCSR
jgi:hypothetical protein